MCGYASIHDANFTNSTNQHHGRWKRKTNVGHDVSTNSSYF